MTSTIIRINRSA